MNILESELIDSSRISVVIQGLTHYVQGDENCIFYKCINSIRKHLPHAEIILSTWKNQSCDESVIDKALYNDEPESIMSDQVETYRWNYNKMVVSTKNGIMASSREYVLKFRIDLSLLGQNFFKITEKNNIPKKLNEFKIFQTPINVSSIFTLSPYCYNHFLFSLSDIVQFGKKENLLDLWSRDLLDESTIKHPVKNWYLINDFSHFGIKMIPEQALMIGWLNFYGHKINLPYATHVTKKNLYLSELSLSLNFNLINWDQSDILYPERFLHHSAVLEKTLYEAKELNQLYQEYDFYLLNKRFFYFLKKAYFRKSIVTNALSNLPRSILLSILSPKLYYILRKKWRAAIKKT
jgi:hypothetical protein